MEVGDIFGLILFLGFLAVSLVGKMVKNQQGSQGGERAPRRQQWPGPMAPPGLPGYPKPSWPAAPPQQTRQPQPPTPRRDDDDNDEGVSMEGPAAGDTVRAELTRFGAGRLAKPDLGQYQPRMPQYQSHLDRLKTTLHTPEADPAGGRAAADPAAGLEAALADPQSVARAFVLAEVLGKPKALRGRGR